VSRPRILSNSGEIFSLLYCLRWLNFHRDLKLLSLFESFIRKLFWTLYCFLKDFSASLLAKEKSYKVFYKASLPKDCLKSIFQKLSYKGLSLILKRDYSKSNFYLHYANKSPWPIHMVFMESCFNYKNLFITVLYGCFEF
jgi:hypothetical protein